MLHKNSVEEHPAAEGEQCAVPTPVDVELANTLVGDDNRRGASWDLVQGPKNYVSLVTAQVTAAVLSFGSVWLATRYLGADGYGGVVALIAASQLVFLLGVNWTSLTVARFGCEEFVETGRIATTFWTRLAILVPNVVLVLALVPLWLPLLSNLLHLPPNAEWFVLGVFLVNASWAHVQQALQGAKLLRFQGWLLTFERVLIFLSICWLSFSGKISVWTVAWVYFVGPLGATVVGLVRLRKLIWPVVRIDSPLLKRMLRFSLPIIPTAFVGFLSTNYLDALFILHFLSQVKLGIYAVTYQLVGLAQQLPLLAGYLLMPLFVSLQTGKQENRTLRFMKEVLPLLTLLWTLACALVAAAGWYLLPLVFGTKFAESGPLMWPLMAATTMAGPILMGYSPVATSTSKTYITMIGVTLGSSANLVLNFLLTPRFGLLGCAWATTAAYGINAIVVFLLVHRRILPGYTWTLQAMLPIVLGALYASLTGKNLGALAVSLIVAVLIALAHRKSIAIGVQTLRDYRRFAFNTSLTPTTEST
ncbi:MAG: lipopolysaccharide biosynthesis protein [Pyrinomonadaceae bacterium]